MKDADLTSGHINAGKAIISEFFFSESFLDECLVTLYFDGPL